MTNGNIAERSHQQPWKWNAVLNIKPSKSKHSHASALQKGNCLCMPLSAPLPHYSHSPPKGLAELLSCCLFSQVVWEQAQQAAGDMSFNRHLCSNKHLWLNLSLVITPFIWIFFTWIQESWKQCCSRYNFQALQFGALFSSQLFLFNWKRNINPAAQSK